MRSLKILFILKKRSDQYGISYGLVNSARFVSDALASEGISSKVVSVTDGNCIDREVSLYRPTHVMVEAIWVVPHKFNTLIRLHPGVKWVVRVHSKTPFLANEGIAIEWLIEYSKLAARSPMFQIAPNSLELTENMSLAMGIRAIYLPNIYEKDWHGAPHVPSGCAINVGCFGAIRPMKNHLLQAMAAMRFAKVLGRPLKFHVNATRTEQNGDSVLKNLRSLFHGAREELVEHPWVSHSDFIGLVRQMDIGMQVSLSESFNIVAADFVSNGVPIVVSRDVDWMPRLYTANPNCTDSIVSTMLLAWLMKPLRMHDLCRLSLWSWNRKARRIWMSYMSE